MTRVRAGAYEMWYAERGPGRSHAGHMTAIVTVHGFVISQRYMAPLAKLLAARHRVLSPDLPGFGRSGKPREVLDIDGLADALVAWMDAVDLPRAHFVGNSMGCQVAMSLAQRHPTRVDRLVLIGPTTDPSAPSVLAQAGRLAHDMLHERPSIIPAHIPDYVKAGPRRILKTLEHVMRDRIEARAPRVRARTLILRGSRDALVSGRFVHELAARMPDARLEELPDAPHAANYSAPEITAAAIERFLSEPRDAGR